MDDHIDVADVCRFERSSEIEKEIIASSTTNDARAARQIETKVCVRHEEDAHVTPTKGPTPGARRRAEVRRRVAAPRERLRPRVV